MTIWENGFGEQFDTFDEAQENVYKNMELDDYFAYMAAQFDSSEDLLRVIYERLNARNKRQSITPIDFWELFEDESYTAEERYFNDNYYEVDKKEDE